MTSGYVLWRMNTVVDI